MSFSRAIDRLMPCHISILVLIAVITAAFYLRAEAIQGKSTINLFLKWVCRSVGVAEALFHAATVFPPAHKHTRTYYHIEFMHISFPWCASGLSAEQEAWLESVSYGNISTDWPPLSVNQSGYLLINVQTFEELTRTSNYPYHQAGDAPIFNLPLLHNPHTPSCSEQHNPSCQCTGCVAANFRPQLKHTCTYFVTR